MASHATVETLADSLRHSPGLEQDVNRLEALAGGAVLTQNAPLASLAFSMADAFTPSRPWEVEVRTRVRQLADLWSNNADLAVEELRRRSAETARALRLG
ncbi:MAG TPA: hypothetical protein DEG43_06390 [Acidimicrobiaceae bacterium]|nr:hypothetical protein [Acidimicrobiaceae bacterium]